MKNKNVKIIDFPEFRQTFEYDCGANALQSVLAFYGINVREEVLIKQVGTTEKGSTIEGIEKVAAKYGLEVRVCQMTIEDLKKYINKRIPVILLLQAWSGAESNDYKSDWKDGHFVVAIGYDENRFYFEDPYYFLRTYLTLSELEERWHDQSLDEKERLINMGIIISGKKGKYDIEKAVHMD
jgi:predicted double-glycine peptidase